MGPKFQKWSKRAATQNFFILSESPGNSETFGTKKILVRGGLKSYRRLKFVDYYHSQLVFKQSFLNEIWLSMHENDRKDKAHKRPKNF